ncbi:DUF4352 domain-containing protein [Desulfosporosinus sp. PR]|uniref:DUF4352 domain-containing protein n=1 Tax=Candidatus Desulfosporosinus nitrosoreducens TaxID=3401928 RepID=UPI0027F65CB7|nr:DUF4352 domain-containing protein [Desulfosporosinus sp. PR]MDQ7094218.1 DUF4352 domain-containing protein [Desulfosporosinus sp. PR]
MNKKILLSLVGLCFIGGLTFGIYRTGIAANVLKSATQKQNTSVSVPDTQSSITPDDKITVSTPAPDTKGKKVQLTQSDDAASNGKNQQEDNLNKLIASGEIIEAKEGEVYPIRKAIVADKSVLFCVEGNRTANPDMMLPPGRYYAVIDFSILNLQNKSYLSSLSNFVLKDSNGYTFRPVSIEGTVGDISGEILNGSDNMRRGEIAFAVPTTEQQFVLQVETGLDTKSIDFAINAISPNLAWPKPYN